jgi:hypothetical protein
MRILPFALLILINLFFQSSSLAALDPPSHGIQTEYGVHRLEVKPIESVWMYRSTNVLKDKILISTGKGNQVIGMMENFWVDPISDEKESCTSASNFIFNGNPIRWDQKSINGSVVCTLKADEVKKYGHLALVFTKKSAKTKIQLQGVLKLHLDQAQSPAGLLDQMLKGMQYE